MAEPADGTGALDALQLPPIALPQQIGRLRKMRMPFATAEVVDVVCVYSPRYREVWLPRVPVHLKLCGACRSRQGVGLCPPAYPEEALHGTFRIHTVLSCFPTVLCTSTEAPLWAEFRGSLLTQEPGSGNCFLVITPAATCDTIPLPSTRLGHLLFSYRLRGAGAGASLRACGASPHIPPPRTPEPSV